MSILFAIILFSFLIFIHELGHFLTAKAFGIRVNEFAMFMGPAIWKKQVGETLYSIRCIPLGGYCAMEGEDQDTDDPRSFQKAAWWKRLIVLVAGAFMNFVAGVLIFAILYLPAKQVAVPVIGEFMECCIFNHDEGLQVGDEILEIDGERIYLNSDISMMLSLNQTVKHDVTVLRNGQEREFHDLTMAHTHVDEEGNEYLHYGFSFGEVRALDLAGKFDLVGRVTADNIRNIRLSLKMLLTGQAGLKDMTGPVGIVQIMSESAESSETTLDAVLNMLSFGGFIAVNLAVMNLLPIPALDGGRIFCLLVVTAVEAVTKKKIDPKYEGYLHAAGMILLLALMAVIFFKDIFTIFKG